MNDRIAQSFIDELNKIAMGYDPARQPHELNLQRMAAKSGGGISFIRGGKSYGTPTSMPTNVLKSVSKNIGAGKFKVVPH